MPDDPHTHPDGSFTLFAEQQVDRLVDARMRFHTLRLRLIFGGLLAATTVFAAVSSVLGYFVYTNNGITQDVKSQSQRISQDEQNLRQYTDQKVQNECAALGLLTAKPVPRPSNPKANPSRETTYEFYIALVYWEKKDGCPVNSDGE